MSENQPPAYDLSLYCGLCLKSFPVSQMALRGKLNFCQTCASERSAECLSRLQVMEQPGKSRWSVIALSLIGAGLVAGGTVAVTKWTSPKPAASESKETVTEKAVANATPAPAAPVEAAAPVAATAPAATPAPASETKETKETKETADADAERQAKERNRRSVEDAGSIHLLFVTRPGTDARMGLASNLYITREAPNNTTAKLTTEVGKQMQTSFDEGLRYVQKQPRDWEKDFSVRLSFEDKFTSKDGGSAGTAFAIAMLAATEKVTLDPMVAVTGDLTVDGTVQPVGAVVEKLRGALDEKCKVTLIPERNSRDVTDLALLDGTASLWDMQIFSISTIDEAFNLARKDRSGKVADAIARFNTLRARLPAKVTPNYLQSPIVQTELKEILQVAPNHLSASVLLKAAENQLPQELSLNRSVEEILAASYLFVNEVLSPPPEPKEKTKASENKGITTFPEREFNSCVTTLQRLSPMLDHRSQDLRMACLAYGSALRTLYTYRIPSEINQIHTQQEYTQMARRERGYLIQSKSELDESRSHVLLALRKLDTDGSMLAELKKK